MDMGENGGLDSEELAPQPMSSVSLGQLIHENRDRLIYLFDMFSDRAYYLELVEAKKQEHDVKYPRVVLSVAQPANQFDSQDTDSQCGSIFDEAMAEFDDFGFGSDEDYSDDEF